MEHSALPPFSFYQAWTPEIAILVLLSVFLPAAIDAAGFHLLGTVDIVLIVL